MTRKKVTKLKPAARNVLECSRSVLQSIDTAMVGRIIKAANAVTACRGKVVTIGVGKSGFIAQKVASTLTSLGVLAVFMNPIDALHGDLGIVSSDDAVIAFSHSGNTRELIEALRHIAKIGPLVVAVCGDASSALVQMSAQKIVYHLFGEGSPDDLAPMASTTTSLVVGDMLAAEIAQRRGFDRQKFAQNHPSGSLGLKSISVTDIMYTGAQLPVIRASASFHDGLTEMTDKSLGVVAVIDIKGRMIGLMTDGDVRRFILSGKYRPNAKMADVMMTSPKTVTITANLYDALKAMEQHRITTLFIVDSKNHPRGVMHLHQIAEHQLA